MQRPVPNRFGGTIGDNGDDTLMQRLEFNWGLDKKMMIIIAITGILCVGSFIYLRRWSARIKDFS